MTGTVGELVARRYDTGEPVALRIVAGRIDSVRPSREATPLWVAPGLVDLQVNGNRGREFNDPELTVDQAVALVVGLDADGVTKSCPTSTTHSRELLTHVMGVLGEALETRPEFARRVPGFHLEGPYLSPEDGPRGAHPREHIRPPDWDEFQTLQQAARGGIRLLTISPEYDESPEFIRRAVDSGVVVSIGHTAATSDQIRAAVDAGATLSTHLGNGAHGQIRRHPNYIWDQLADDRLVACLIADGHHLPASVLQCFLRAKTVERCLLVSDITGLGGMPPGRYDTQFGAVEVLEDGRMVVAGQRQYLAGAALPLRHCVAHLHHAIGLPLATCLELASLRASAAIGLAPTRLEPGSPADLILFEPPAPGRALEVQTTILGGELVHGEAGGKR